MNFREFTCTLYKNNIEEYKEHFKNKSKNKNKLKFRMLEFDTTIDKVEQTFLRENEEYIFFLDIKNKKCKVVLKKENIDFNVMVEEATMKDSNNQIIIEYFIETDEARNKIRIQESGYVYE